MNQANDRARSTGAAHTWRRGLRSWTQQAALKAITNNIAVTERFLRVCGLIDAPTRLQDLALFLRILIFNVRPPASGGTFLSPAAFPQQRA